MVRPTPGQRRPGVLYALTHERVTGADSAPADNFIGFHGGFFIGSPAQTQFNHRWYDPRLGRFTQPDTIGTPGSSGNGQDNRNGIEDRTTRKSLFSDLH